MAMGRRALCALVAAAAGVATVATRGAVEGRMIVSAAAWAQMLAASAAAGTLVLPGRVWPRARGWLRPPVGGLLTAGLAMLLALAPDALGRMTRVEQIDDALLWLAIGAVYALLVAGPVFAAAALALHIGLRLKG